MNNPAIVVATATRQGTGENNADAASVFTASDGTVAAALIDIAGHHPGAPVLAERLAWRAAAIGARYGATAAVLDAAALVADPGDGLGAGPLPDGAIVVAVLRPGRPPRICAAGDSVAYGWDGRRLTARTVPQGVGDDLRVGLGTAVATTVAAATAPAGEMLLLVSDGADLGRGTLEALAREHAADPQALADAIVDAAASDGAGCRDDATAIVVGPEPPAREFRRRTL
ncbi:hypothetical protein GCM10010387_49310 [Streptomyces inusitatus]|uniref:PPM-type phosphatase domain-containing protein n=1 Tax=Streptomyces inusitatus TaxID=68221 RepID=A0A918UZG2_9ACTN|nr:SpoIIE family protein phosphatase [Streptomyces inusitatus]GGZ49030.1 hypothetical protein GCM10010387_49310 [Streptomyces inusitatus]